jgi:hypothetical protein
MLPLCSSASRMLARTMTRSPARKAAESAELVVRLSGQGVEVAALGVGHGRDAGLDGLAIDAAALEVLPLRDDRRSSVGLRRVPVEMPFTVVRREGFAHAAGTQVLGRARLPSDRLPDRGLHVDAWLDRARHAQRVAVRDGLELPVVAGFQHDGPARPRLLDEISAPFHAQSRRLVDDQQLAIAVESIAVVALPGFDLPERRSRRHVRVGPQDVDGAVSD